MEQYDSRQDTLDHKCKVKKFMDIMIGNIVRRSINHDNSKLESPEKEIFDEYTPKLKNCTYGSDEYNSYLEQMKVALDHHYANNSHHPENKSESQEWYCTHCGYSYGYINEPSQALMYANSEERCINCEHEPFVYKTRYTLRRMTLVDLIEMISDWKAASLRHADGDIMKSIEINQDRFGYGYELKQILINTVEYYFK